jgi:hypothetical protein
MPCFPDDADPVEMACRLSAQAELLALNAGREALRDPTASRELQRLAAEARELARRGREVAEHHRLLAAAEALAAQVLDDGPDEGMLVDGGVDGASLPDPFTDPARAARRAVERFLARAEQPASFLRPGNLPH